MSPTSLTLYSEAPLPTPRGTFRTMVFRETDTGREHVALVLGDLSGPPPLVRLHSECLTSEVFGSLKCDCREQLDRALDAIAREGRGALLYLRQEGRGIGLGEKIRAYALQAQGLDTYEANRRLGHPDDARRYDVAFEMLRTLGLKQLRLMTNNPLKLQALMGAGFEVTERVPAPAVPNPHSVGYLRVKRDATGHWLGALTDGGNGDAHGGPG